MYDEELRTQSDPPREHAIARQDWLWPSRRSTDPGMVPKTTGEKTGVPGGKDWGPTERWRADRAGERP